jgi:hypothetical protein
MLDKEGCDESLIKYNSSDMSCHQKICRMHYFLSLVFIEIVTMYISSGIFCHRNKDGISSLTRHIARQFDIMVK